MIPNSLLPENKLTLSEQEIKDAIEIAHIYAIKAARQYGFHMLEDFKSELVMTIWIAHQSFDPSKKTTWKTWLISNLQFAIQNAIKDTVGTKNSHQRKYLNTHTQIASNDPELDQIIERIQDDTNTAQQVLDDIQHDRQLQYLETFLTPLQFYVIYRHWYLGHTYEQISSSLGTSRSNTHLALQAAKKKLKTRCKSKKLIELFGLH